MGNFTQACQSDCQSCNPPRTTCCSDNRNAGLFYRHSFDMQMWPLLFTDKKSISSLSNNSDCSNCISIVSKQTQSEILQLLFGNSLSIQILRDQSWWWAFATSQVIVPAKHHEYPTFPLAMLFNESMHKKCVSNLNLHLILNILWAISSPAIKVKQKQWNPPSFPSCSLASVSPLKVLLSVFFRW